jgi:hypothetical protein
MQSRPAAEQTVSENPICRRERQAGENKTGREFRDSRPAFKAIKLD